MPMRRVHRGRRRRQRGRGFMEWMGKANNFLRSSKLVSRVGSALGRAGVPYAGAISTMAGKLGYGRKSGRRHCGGSLRLAGGIRM